MFYSKKNLCKKMSYFIKIKIPTISFESPLQHFSPLFKTFSIKCIKDFVLIMYFYGLKNFIKSKLSYPCTWFLKFNFFKNIPFIAEIKLMF